MTTTSKRQTAGGKHSRKAPPIPGPERALARLCRGYSYREQVWEKCKAPGLEAEGRKVGEREERQVVELKKQRPPDLEAIKLWHSLNRPAAGGAAVPLYVVDDVGPGHGGGD